MQGLGEITDNSNWVWPSSRMKYATTYRQFCNMLAKFIIISYPPSDQDIVVKDEQLY